MPKPGFFLVGAPKCGTTSLHDHLAQHPALFLPAVKEPTFFGSDVPLVPAVGSLEAYVALFDAGEGRLCGEASTNYLASTSAAREIHAFNPDARIIVALRNPVDFLPSYHMQQVFEGNEDLADFAAALAAEPDRRAGRRLPPRCLHPAALRYREAATFSVQLARWLDVFGRDAVHVVVFDDFVADAPAVMRALYAFLGVSPDFAPVLGVKNPSMTVRSRLLQRVLTDPRLRRLGKRVIPEAVAARMGQAAVRLNARPEVRAPVPAALRAALVREFRPEVRRLGELVGRELSRWSDPA